MYVLYVAVVILFDLFYAVLSIHFNVSFSLLFSSIVSVMFIYSPSPKKTENTYGVASSLNVPWKQII